MDFSAPCDDSDQPKPLCHCLGIHADEIQGHITERNLSSVRGVTKACGAGGGCTSCHRHIKRMLVEHAAQKRMAAPAPVFAIEPLLGCV